MVNVSVKDVAQAVRKATVFSASYGFGGAYKKGAIFSKHMVQLAIALKSIHIELGSSTSLGVPTPPLEAIELNDALNSEDAPEWHKAIIAELESLKKIGTLDIRWGSPPAGKKLISNRWVLRKKFNREMNIARCKARLVIRGYK